MKNLNIRTWDVDAQPVDNGFSSFIDVHFDYKGVEFAGSIQEDCGHYVEWHGEDDFYGEIDEEVKEYILEKALNDIKEAQQEHKDSAFECELLDNEQRDLIEEVASLIVSKSMSAVTKINAQKWAKKLVEISEDDFSISDSMIQLQISFEMEQSDSSLICNTARKYEINN